MPRSLRLLSVVGLGLLSGLQAFPVVILTVRESLAATERFDPGNPVLPGLPEHVRLGASRPADSRDSFRGPGPLQLAQVTASRPQTTPQLGPLEKRLQQFTKEQVAETFGQSGHDILEKANRARESAENLLSILKWVSSGWLTVVSLIFATLVFYGWKELGLVKAARDEADKAASAASESAGNAKEAEGQVTRSIQRLQAIDQAVARAIADLEDYFQALPRLEGFGVVGLTQDLPSSEEIMRFEEADTILVLAEKIKSVPGANLFVSFMRLGRYWALVANYPRAIARFKQAINLEPRASAARSELGSILSRLAAEERTGPVLKKRLLDEAERECNAVIQLAGRNALVLHDLGWIYDEREDYERAVELYREAQGLDVAGDYPNITYNLACSYSKWKKYSEALEELRKVIDKNANWIYAPLDRDFAALFQDETFGPRFQQLIAEETARHP